MKTLNAVPATKSFRQNDKRMYFIRVTFCATILLRRLRCVPLRNVLDKILKEMGNAGLAIPTKHHDVFTNEEQDIFWKNQEKFMAEGMDGKLHYTCGQAYNDVHSLLLFWLWCVTKNCYISARRVFS